MSLKQVQKSSNRGGKRPEGNLNLTIKYGLSSVTSDIDNPTKPFLDILQKNMDLTIQG